ncbi:MAG: hypothetical protein ACLPJW_12710 [Rhodomicrobium sp.]
MAISLSGLDMPWLGKTPLPKKPKRRGRPPKSKRSDLASPYYMSDIKPFISPVGDTPLISSRPQLAAHCREHGMVQVGDELKGKIVEKGVAKQKALAEAGKGVTVEWTA